MVRKITKSSSPIVSAFVVCFLSTGCALVNDNSGIFQTSDQRLLSKLERKHNRLRAKTKQELANNLETLIKAHPDLVFGYQRMTTSDDPVVANIARYRLAQVHLELGCALEEVTQQAEQHDMQTAALENMTQSHLEHAAREFSKVQTTQFALPPNQINRWHHAFANRTKGNPQRKTVKIDAGSEFTRFEDGSTRLSCWDTHWREVDVPLEERDLLGFSRNRTHTCLVLESEYLDVLRPFVY